MMHFIHNTLKLITPKLVLQIQLSVQWYLEKNQYKQTILRGKIWLATKGVLLSGK